MLAKRSAWSSLVLSWAVLGASSALVSAQESAPAPAAEVPAATATAPAAAPAAPAPAAAGAAEVTTEPAPATEGPPKDAIQYADDFMHYSLVNNADLAKANGEKLLNLNLEPQTFLQAFEAAANGRDPRTVMERDLRRAELKEVAGKLIEKLEEGYRASVRNRDRIRAEVRRLAGGFRAYQNARSRLLAAGQYAVPVMLEFLQDERAKDLHSSILKVMTEMGRSVLPPLIAQLDMSEQGDKVSLIKVVGAIGYPQPLPALVKIANDPKSGAELRRAANDAILALTQGRGVGSVSAAELYLQSAESYFHRKASFQPVNTNEAMNPIWVYHKESNNVDGVPVPTAIWCDIMAQRTAERSLTLQQNNPAAISTWIAAGLKREIDLPANARDPLKDESKPTAGFIGEAAGPVYLNPVLTRALDDRDSALILRTLDLLQNTAGIEGLVPPKALASTAPADDGLTPPAPVVRALAYADRAVRFKAAEILAKANPNERFPGYYRVVPVLAEAITQTGAPSVLLVDSNQNNRNRIKEMLRSSAAAYNVYDGPTLAAAVSNSRKAAAFDLIIINHNPDVARIRDVGKTDYRLATPAVLVMGPANTQASLRLQLQNMAGFAAIPEDVKDEPAIAEAAKSARGAQGTPIDQTAATNFALSAITLLGQLSSDHASIYRVDDALQALIDALKDKRAEIATAAAKVLGQMYNADAERALASAALSADITDNNIRTALFKNLAESAKKNRNVLDAPGIDKLIKVVQGEQDPQVRAAAATALGALNVPSNQASTLILQQMSK